MLKSRLGEGNVLESMTEFTFVKHMCTHNEFHHSK
jgi:hypothetical protein